MRILQLSTSNVRGLRDGAWTFDADRGRPGPVTVVTGPAASGLTTFLDAVAFTSARLAMGLAPTAGDVLRAGATTAMIGTSWWLDADERAFGGLAAETTDAEVVFAQGSLGRTEADPALLGLMSRYDHTKTTGKVVLIPARRVGDGVSLSLGDFEADQQLHRWSSEAGKFSGLLGALTRHANGTGDRARFEAVRALLADLCHSARLVWGEVTGEVEFELTSGMRVPLKRLGFGERNAFVVAAVPVLLGLHRSVVLLDTPEVGLPPGLAARWLRALQSHLPEAQWIVASRDPDVVSSVDRRAVVELGRSAS